MKKVLLVGWAILSLISCRSKSKVYTGPIEIKKGGAYGAIVKPNEPLFEITQGEEDLSGDGAPLLKDARNNWKKSCADWKKEFKDMNKLNQILTMNCGKQVCTTEAMETTCSSKATYKLKVRVN